MFLEISQNSQENTCARVSFLITLQASGTQNTPGQLPLTITHWIEKKVWGNSREQFPKKAQMSQWARHSYICYSKIGVKKLREKREWATVPSGTAASEEMMRAANMKKMMVPPAKFARLPGTNWRRNVEIVFNAIYAGPLTSAFFHRKSANFVI